MVLSTEDKEKINIEEGNAYKHSKNLIQEIFLSKIFWWKKVAGSVTSKHFNIHRLTAIFDFFSAEIYGITIF